jgi:hypothetical protein
VQLSDLRALLALLREFNATEYDDGTVRLKLGPVKSDQPSASQPQPGPPLVGIRDAAATVSPALAEAVARLPEGYQQFFTGVPKQSD